MKTKVEDLVGWENLYLPPDQDWPNIIWRTREARGLSLSQLADKVEMNLTDLHDYEAGCFDVSDEQLSRLRFALNIIIEKKWT